MIQHPSIGIEFNLMGYEIPGSYKDTDPTYANLIAKVLEVAEEEGFLIDVPENGNIVHKPLIERMVDLGNGDQITGLLFDHEVPAVLRMTKIALANMPDKDRDETSYRYLPRPATMKILIASLEEYERLIQDD